MANQVSNKQSNTRKRLPIIVIILVIVALAAYFLARPKQEVIPENQESVAPVYPNKKIRMDVMNANDTAGINFMIMPFFNIQRGAKATNVTVSKPIGDTGTLILRGNGYTDFFCGHCDSQLGSNVPEESLEGTTTVKCNGCKSVNWSKAR